MAGFIPNGTFTIAAQRKIFHGLFSWFNIKVSQKYQLIVEEKALEEKAYVIIFFKWFDIWFIWGL